MTEQDTQQGSQAPLLIERDGHVATWTINRPESRNPISDDEMVAAFIDAVDAANADPEIRVVILTGAGSAFSAGGDVKKMRDGEGIFGGHPHQIRRGYRYGIQQIPLALQRLDVPLIAAVNGPAVGAGCDLTAMADMRIAREGVVRGVVREAGHHPRQRRRLVPAAPRGPGTRGDDADR